MTTCQRATRVGDYSRRLAVKHHLTPLNHECLFWHISCSSVRHHACISRREEPNMKTTIIGTLLLGLVLSSIPVYAATTCLCVGRPGSSSRECGNGGAGGEFLRVIPTSPSNIKIFLLSTARQAEFNSAGKAYDATTGWFCWNGTLR